MGTWIVGVAVACIVAFAAYRLYRDRKNEKGCGSGCDGCANKSGCSEAE